VSAPRAPRLALVLALAAAAATADRPPVGAPAAPLAAPRVTVELAPGTELRTAYDQQGKIMRLRLEKLFRTRDGTRDNR